MSPPVPDLLVITAQHEEDLNADSVALRVTVQGSSLVTGRAALSQAKEVARLVEELGRAGVPPEAIMLEAVHAQQTSGMLGRSSAAVYKLRVRCPELERLPDALGAVTAARSAALEEIVWGYPDTIERQTRWLAAAIEEANVKARAAASALGTRVVGVHHMTEQRLDQGGRRAVELAQAPALRRSAAIELGFELGQQRRAGIRVTVQYRVEGYDPGGASSR